MKSYEALMGAVGRSVFYRPERQRVRELLSRDARPELIVNGQEFPLFDLSMNGLSFLIGGEASCWDVGDEVTLSLLLHHQEVYRGLARVARVDRGPKGSRIGVGLATGFLDLPQIRRQDDEKRLERQLSRGPESVRALLSSGYLDVVARLTHFHSYYRRSLGEHEQRYRLEGKGDDALLDLAQSAYEAICGRWWDLEVEASRATIECLDDRERLLAAKQLTEDMVTPLVLDSALGRRAYLKPLGYAGDYQVMLYMYDNRFEGDTVYGKVIHKCYASDHPMCRGVRTRNDLIVHWVEEEHTRFVEEHGDSTSFRIVGLGCGPAREVSNFVARNRAWPGNIVWTLIDQEEEALSVAFRESKAEIAKWGSAVQLNLLNLSFVQLVSNGLPLSDRGSQNLVYSAGLFDYLHESRAQVLIRALYELLATGGLMAVGNLVAPNEFFWGAECLMDWTTLYRTRDEMFRLADLIPDTAAKEVVLEPSGAYHFLLIRKH